MHVPAKATTTFANGEMTSGVIKLFPYEDALFHIPTGTEGTGNDFDFYGCTSETGTFVEIVDTNGTTVTSTPTVNKWQTFPADVFGMPYIKIVNASTQTAARTVTVAGHAPR